MPASSDSPPDAFPGSRTAPPLPATVLRSLMPALDRAFGLEADPELPEDLAALVTRLQGGSGIVAANGPDAEAGGRAVDRAPDRAAVPPRSEPVPA